MNKNKIWLLAVMIAIVGVAVISCPPPDEELGSISISPSGEVKIGSLLTATYGGTEAVKYQWKLDGNDVTSGGNAKTLTAMVAGKYTVTISFEGFEDKTSNTVTVSKRAVFFETWSNSKEKLVLTANQLDYYYDGELSYTMETLTWTEITANSGAYLWGYKITGTLAFEHPTDPFNPNKTGSLTDESGVGDLCDDFWYINALENAILPGKWADINHSPNDTATALSKQ
jgi:hypothetical protein